jgi:hypothetical protein
MEVCLTNSPLQTGRQIPPLGETMARIVRICFDTRVAAVGLLDVPLSILEEQASRALPVSTPKTVRESPPEEACIPGVML